MNYTEDTEQLKPGYNGPVNPKYIRDIDWAKIRRKFNKEKKNTFYYSHSEMFKFIKKIILEQDGRTN